MKDTSANTQQVFEDMIFKKTPGERAQMAFSLFNFAKEIVVSSIKESRPDISEGELRAEVFLRFYGDDFSDKDKEKIIRYLKDAQKPEFTEE